MSATATPRSHPSPTFLDAFRAAAGETATLSFADFMALALYHPEVGYYRRARPRVGRGAGTDFYTATSSGPIFGELICAACVKLLGPQDPRTVTFVEIGAESAGGVLAGVAHPFAAARTVRLGEPLALSVLAAAAPGPLIVFSNELFDAQPVHRFVVRERGWRELGVRLTPDHRLVDTELPLAPHASAARPTSARMPLPAWFELPAPAHLPEGYHLDAPCAAAALAETLASQSWTGLFIACDYGKSWRELSEVTPHGTVRAYRQHTQSNDLLAHPGEQDLTSHVCWDWLSAALARHRFSSPTVESQEAFFIHHASDFIAATIAAEAARLSPRKLSLMQLLHPANMGQKFQVLHAVRV